MVAIFTHGSIPQPRYVMDIRGLVWLVWLEMANSYKVAI